MPAPELNAERLTRDSLDNELDNHTHSNNIRCPFHNDKSASGSIHQDSDLVWRYTCHGGDCHVSGDVFDIRAHKQNKTVAEILRDASNRNLKRPPPPAPLPFPTAGTTGTMSLDGIFQRHSGDEIYPYRIAASDEPVLVVVRTPSKKFLQLRKEGDGYVYGGLRDEAAPLYNLPLLKHQSEVIVVEGEKCVHALRDYGYTNATTSPGGSSNGDSADWSPLAGKRVVLWPDNDTAGSEYMDGVGETLSGLGCSLSRIDPRSTGVCEKGDAADFIASGGDVAQAIRSAKSLGPLASFDARIEAIIDGTYSSVDWTPQFRILNDSQSLTPGSITIFCGAPGSAKSFFATQLAWGWMRDGMDTALFAMEGDPLRYLHRALAQIIGRSHILAFNSVSGLETKEAMKAPENRSLIEKLARAIEGPRGPCGVDGTLDWMRRRLDLGARVLLLDPVTASISGEKEAWLSSWRVMDGARELAESYGSSIVMTTHPKQSKQNKQPDMADLAGGAAFERFAESVIWVERRDRKEDELVEQQGLPPGTVDFNRVITVLKCRDGANVGVKIAYQFSPESVSFTEKGKIAKL